MQTLRAFSCLVAGLALVACSSGTADAPDNSVASKVSGTDCEPRPECPAVMLPPKSDCPNGEFIPKKDQSGCTRGFECVETAPCPSIALPPADSCQGVWVPRTDATGCTREFECRPCPPEPMLPPASSCPDGVIVPKRVGNACITDYSCITGPTCPNVAQQEKPSCGPGGSLIAHFAESGCVTHLTCQCALWQMPPADFCGTGGDLVPVAKKDPVSGCVLGIFCEKAK